MGSPHQTIKERLNTTDGITRIREKLGEGISSRSRLAMWICEQKGLRDARGRLRISSCLKVLRDMEAQGHFQLPPRRSEGPSPWRPRRLSGAVAVAKNVPEEVGSVRGLELILVKGADEERMRIWNELIAREHPRGKQRLVGRQMRYLVGSEHGWLGAVGWSASALYLEARDRWVGWDAESRRRHEKRVVNLSRFLIRPGVRCQHLASRVLGMCARRVGEDFEGEYGYRPWLLETFVDQGSQTGTCFRAANWERVGETKGRGRNDRQCRARESVKDIYVYPLVDDFRRRMGVRPPGGLKVTEGLETSSWAKQEFGGVVLGDKRLESRLIRVAEDRANRPEGSYLEGAKGARSAAKSYYRFIDSSRETVTPEAMRAAHRARTIERMRGEKVVLVIQDTTDLNFSTRSSTMGLGLIGTNQTGAKSMGLKLHTGLAVNEAGVPLGVIQSVGYAPISVSKKRKNRPLEEKKTFRWVEGYRACVAVSGRIPGTRLITVMDREGDFFDMFREAEQTRTRVGILVRARHDRCVDETGKKLFDELRRGGPEARTVAVTIPRQRAKPAKGKQPEQKGLPERRGHLTIFFKPVVLEAPRPEIQGGPVKVWAVVAREENPPPGARPIEWFLLTTEEIRTWEDAVRCVRYYSRRWRIEEWHRVLKSGCQVEAHQHQTVDRLRRAIAIDGIVAWRIQVLTLVGREAPRLKADVLFDEWELKVLEVLQKQQNTKASSKPLLLGEAIIAAAQLGGYLNRPCDGPPGTECLWRGLTHLSAMAHGMRLAMECRPP